VTIVPDIACDQILVALEGAVATVTIDRPEKLNSMTEEMSTALVAVAEWADSEDGVRVLILTGAGDRAFCTGSDITSLEKYTTPWEFRNRRDYCDALRELRKPIIAAINGYAYGGGLEAALICDIRLASSTASFAASEIKLGWIGGGGVSSYLAHAIGASNAAMMMLTGDPVSATQAHLWGLVSELHEREDLLPAAKRMAETIASRAPIAAQTGKANLRAAFNMPHDEAIRYERDLQTIAFATEDAAEGRRAFAEKRPADFHGR
jgi:enoyl-CoA hydratase/carnithine racemase